MRNFRGFTLIVAVLLLVGSVAAASEETDPIEFDPEFIASFQNNRNKQLLADYPKYIQSRQQSADGKTKGDLLVEIFRFVSDFSKRVHDDPDQIYVKEGDYRQYLSEELKQIPNLKFYGELLHSTVESDALRMRLDSGGVGLRLDVYPLPNGTVSFVAMPAYAEFRKFNTVQGIPASGSDIMIRASAGVTARQKFGDRVELVARVIYQPNLTDFEQCRVFFEIFTRFKIIESKSVIQQFNIVPKFVYWKSTDTSGIGDAVNRIFGNTYLQLDSIRYGFLNLEFRIRM